MAIGASSAGAAETVIDTIDFGSHLAGTAGKTESFSIVNDDPTEFTLNPIQVRGTNVDSFAIEADDCSGRTLLFGDECQFNIRFVPKYDPLVRFRTATRRAEVLIGDNASPDLAIIRVNGEVLRPALLSIRRLSGTGVFRTTAAGRASAPQAFTLINFGDVAGIVPQLSINGSGAGHFAIRGDGCSGTALAPGASCNFQVVFVPTGEGIHGATVGVIGDSAQSGTVSVTGVATPTLTRILKALAGDWATKLNERGIVRAIKRKVLFLGGYDFAVTGKLRGTLYLRSKGHRDRPLASAKQDVAANRVRALRLIPVRRAKRALARAGSRPRLVLKLELVETSGMRTVASRVVRLR